MQESSGRKNDIPDPESDATSKETVADLEDNEESSAVEPGNANEADVPSPDGAFDGSDESKDAGPM